MCDTLWQGLTLSLMNLGGLHPHVFFASSLGGNPQIELSCVRLSPENIQINSKEILARFDVLTKTPLGVANSVLTSHLPVKKFTPWQ